MDTEKLLSLLQCPVCRSGGLHAGDDDLTCVDCDTRFPLVDGIPDLTPHPESREDDYQTDSVRDSMASFYDLVAPLMSLGIWHCDPLRYVDSENRALGRANGGVYLQAPVSTGIVLNRCLADYHDVSILCVDSSWEMLRRARQRLERFEDRVAFVRVDFAALPLKAGVVRSVQSSNALHTMIERERFVREVIRVTEPGGFISGSALIRGEERVADLVLDRFERNGLFPMLRRGNFLMEELRNAGAKNLHHATHGAVLFYDFMR